MKAGDLFALPLLDGRWGACQAMDDRVVLALDWVGERPPRPEDLSAVGPLVLDHHAHPGKVLRQSVPLPPPDWVVSVGHLEPLAQLDTPNRTSGSWISLPYQISAQWRWAHELPADLVSRYRAASASESDASLELGGKRFTIPERTWKLNMGGTGRYAFDPRSPVRWSELDSLGALTHLEYDGTDPDVLVYVQKKPLIQHLIWTSHGQAAVDLSRVELEELAITANADLELALPKTLRVLRLLSVNPSARLVVKHPRRGRGIRLELHGRELPHPIADLDELTDLSASFIELADLSRVCGYRHLAELSLSGAPGKLQGLAKLVEMSALRALRLHEFYVMDIGELPATGVPLLRSVSIDGLRKSDATVLGRQLTGIADVSIRGAKTDAWIRANVDNPLRSWHDVDRADGERACKAFKKAFNKAQKHPEEAEGRALLQEFVTVLNRIDARSGIDTIMREQAYEAFAEIASTLGVSDEHAEEWFDAWREF